MADSRLLISYMYEHGEIATHRGIFFQIKELLKEMKEYRDGMVVRNLPYQWISDIITKWETRDISKDPFKGTHIEGKD